MALNETQMAERLAMIKAAAQKIEKRKEFKRRQAANAAAVRRWTDEVEKPRRKAKEDAFDAEIARLNENHNQWTDAPQYAKKYYGDIAYETTRFDNDWD
jgi:hypothetical protein